LKLLYLEMSIMLNIPDSLSVVSSVQSLYLWIHDHTWMPTSVLSLQAEEAVAPATSSEVS